MGTDVTRAEAEGEEFVRVTLPKLRAEFWAEHCEDLDPMTVDPAEIQLRWIRFLIDVGFQQG